MVKPRRVLPGCRRRPAQGPGFSLLKATCSLPLRHPGLFGIEAGEIGLRCSNTTKIGGRCCGRAKGLGCCRAKGAPRGRIAGPSIATAGPAPGGVGGGSSYVRKTECRRLECSYPGNVVIPGRQKTSVRGFWSVIPGAFAIGDGYGKIRRQRARMLAGQSAPAREGEKARISFPQGFILQVAEPSATRILTGVFRRRKGLEPSCAHYLDFQGHGAKNPWAGLLAEKGIEIAHQAKSTGNRPPPAVRAGQPWNILFGPDRRLRRMAQNGNRLGQPQAAETGLRLPKAGRRRSSGRICLSERRHRALESLLSGFLNHKWKPNWEHRFAPDLPLLFFYTCRSRAAA